MVLWFSEPVAAEGLLQVYQQALQADPKLRTAEYTLEMVSAQSGQALGQLLPQVNGTVNFSKNNQSNVGGDTRSYDGARYYVSLTQSLLDFSKFWDWKRSQKVEDQYSAELEAAKHQLLLSVAERYFAVLDADEALTLAKLEKQTTETQLNQTKQQFAKQLIKITDLYEVEARLDQIQADEIEAASRLKIAQQALRELTNASSPPLEKLREDISYNELEGNLDDWIEVAKSQNPSMSAQLSAIDAADDNVVTQKTRYLPVVDLQLNYYDTDTGFQSVQTNHTQTQVAAINVNVPIFTGGTTTNKVAEANARLKIAKEQHESLFRELMREVSDAFTSSNANAMRVKASQKALSSAITSRESMKTGLEYGVQSIADLMRAQQLEFKAKRELAKSRYQYISNRFKFLKLSGAISEANIIEVDDWLVNKSTL
jgi:outer membrane protein